MKRFQTLIYWISFLLMGCYNVSPQKSVSRFAGSYSRFTEHEFGSEYDTIVISEMADRFSVNRRWKYIRKADGKMFEPEYKVRNTYAIQNKDARSLYEGSTGITISLDVSRNILVVGTTNYNRINP